MKKRIFMLVMVSILIVLLSGSVFAEVTLRVSWWGSQNRHDRTLEAIKLFEEKNPDINIEPEFLGWDGYWEKMAAQSAGKNLPDVWQQDYMYLMLYANRGLLLNMNSYVESNELDLTNVAETAISGGKIDGNLFGVNLGLNSPAVVYDPALFEKAGVELPSPDWTYEDYMSIARKLHDNLEIYGASRLPVIPTTHGFGIYLRQFGKDIYNAEGTALGYEDDQFFIDYHAMELDLIKEGVIAPMDITSEITNVEEDLIVSKKVAMTDLWSNQIIALDSAAGRPLEMVVLPKNQNQVQEGQFLKPSMFFSVTKYTENPDAAIKFVDFFTNDLEANKILMAERGVPISSKIRDGLKPELGDTQVKMFDYINLAAEHSSKISPPNPEGHNQVAVLYDNLHEMIAYEVITLEEAAKEFRTKANEILSK